MMMMILVTQPVGLTDYETHTHKSNHDANQMMLERMPL